MNLPKLPTRAELTTLLRSLNEQFAHPNCGPEYVSLYCDGAGWPDAHWTVGCDGADWPSAGNEWVPGEARFDAVGAATRLLSDARGKGFK